MQPDGERIRDLRTEHGLTALKLGRRIGRSRQAITNIERGHRASMVLISQLAKALKVDISDITLPAEDADDEPSGQAA